MRRRTATRTGTFRRRRRVSKDWVYHLESYGIDVNTVTTGIANSACFRLVDSSHHILYPRGPAAVPLFEHGEARPEARRRTLYGFQGHMMTAPTTWALGSTIHIVAALVIVEQDVTTGACVLDPQFNLGSSGTDFYPGVWANSAEVVRVWRYQQTFGTSNDNTLKNLHFNWFSQRGRRLRNEDGVFLYIELPTSPVTGTATNQRFQLYCRSLVNRY